MLTGYISEIFKKRTCTFCKLVLISLCSVILIGRVFATTKDTQQSLALCDLSTSMSILAFSFEKKYGIAVRTTRNFGSGAVLARLEHERENPQCDVWEGGSIGAHAQASYSNLTIPYRPASFDKLDPRFRDPLGENRVTGITVGLLGLVVNEAVFRKAGLPSPKSWRELTDSRYRGMIGLKNPVMSGTAYTTLATLVQIMGEDRAFDYFKKLQPNLSRTLDNMTGEASVGNIGVAITFKHEYEGTAPKFRRKLKFIIPEEGTGYEIAGISLVKNGPNPELARRFIDYALSKEGMLISHKIYGATKLLVHLDAQEKERDFLANSSTLINYDFVWAGKNRERLIRRFLAEIAPIPRARLVLELTP